MKEPNCQACGGATKKHRKADATSNGLGCLFLVVGVILCLTGIGAVVGVPVLVIGVWMGCKATNYWKCRECGTLSERA